MGSAVYWHFCLDVRIAQSGYDNAEMFDHRISTHGIEHIQSNGRIYSIFHLCSVLCSVGDSFIFAPVAKDGRAKLEEIDLTKNIPRQARTNGL